VSPEIQLVQAFAANRSHEAFAEIVRTHAGLVYSACYRVLGEAARAEEAAQETFFYLSQHAENVTGSLAGWLHTAATRISINIVKSDVARKRREQEFASLPDSDLKWEHVAPQIDEAMLELDGEQRELLISHFLNRKTQCDLAEDMDVSQATVSRRIEAALTALREKLKSRGVAASVAVLMTGMATQSAQAAPAALTQSLGKMTMGIAAGMTAQPVPQDVYQPREMTPKRFAAATLLLVAAIALFYFFRPSSPVSLEQQAAPEEERARAAAPSPRQVVEDLQKLVGDGSAAPASVFVSAAVFAQLFDGPDLAENHNTLLRQWAASAKGFADAIDEGYVVRDFEHEKPILLPAGTSTGLLQLKGDTMVIDGGMIVLGHDGHQRRIGVNMLVLHDKRWYFMTPLEL
jgi:RNA polymerase sigma-70 factor (ECF subfamily)